MTKELLNLCDETKARPVKRHMILNPESRSSIEGFAPTGDVATGPKRPIFHSLAVALGLAAKGRPGWKPPGEMNPLEAAYAAHLQGCMDQGKIAWYAYEGITLTLVHGRKGKPGSRYTADFAVMLADGTLELHECKGFSRGQEKSLNKFKQAASMYPFVFRLVRQRGKVWDILDP